MSEGGIYYQGDQRKYRCEFERTLKGDYCSQRGHVSLDGLLLCDGHARQLRVEERVAYCRATLAHVELWSREARTRGREDIVDLLEIERRRASVALGSVLKELEQSEGLGEGDSGPDHGGDGNGKGAGGKGDGKGGENRRVILLWPPLLLLLSSF
jgi:hypothetical protein